MSYELFDDVAFYFVLCCILFTLLAPWTSYKLYNQFCDGTFNAHDPEHEYCLSEDSASKTKKVAMQKVTKSKFTPCNILFGLLWLAFILLMIQLPNFQGEEFVTFEPYTILGIEEGATDSQIKKAYRKESLKWHPDKNPDNPEAEEMFIMVSKAYQTLTDPVTKEKFEKFGNPDGLSGMSSMTIGLPSFLTRSENELAILLLYFLVLIVIPPIGVWMWWSKAKHMHPSGIFRRTIYYYFKLITPNMAPKFLIEVLASSVEFRELGTNHQTEKDKNALKSLARKIKDYKVKQKIDKPYVNEATILIYAFLLNLDIPESLQQDLSVILEKAHVLLGVMLETCMKRGFHSVMFNVFKLMQCLSQAQRFDAKPLQQLPLLSERDLKFLARKQVKSLTQFKKTSRETLEEACPHVTPEQWDEIETAANWIPSVHLDVNAGVQDEEGIYAGDVVRVVLKLTRMTKKEVVEGFEVEEETKDEEDEESEDEDEVRLPEPKKNRIPIIKPTTYAYTPNFPVNKKEVWYVTLAQVVGKQRRIVAFQKVSSFSREEEVILFTRVMAAGKWFYEVRVHSDSYMGCDIAKLLELTVGKASELEKKIEEAESESEEEEEEEQEPSQIWDIIVLILLVIFAYNWLQSKGYWQQYVTPIIVKLQVLFQPLVDRIYPTIKPVWDPAQEFVEMAYARVSSILTRDIPEESLDDF